jgi:hypothetical protein
MNFRTIERRGRYAWPSRYGICLSADRLTSRTSSVSQTMFTSTSRNAHYFLPRKGFFVRERILSVVDINPNIRFYLLLDSAQIFFRKALIHHNFKKIVFNIVTIADNAGLTDNNPWKRTFWSSSESMDTSIPMRNLAKIRKHRNILSEDLVPIATEIRGM